MLKHMDPNGLEAKILALASAL